MLAWHRDFGRNAHAAKHVEMVFSQVHKIFVVFDRKACYTRLREFSHLRNN